MSKTKKEKEDVPRFPHALLFVPENYVSVEAYLKAREDYFKVAAEAEAKVKREGYPCLILPD